MIRLIFNYPRRLLIMVSLMVAILPLKAQYVPTNAQAFQFAPVINPAFSGIENFSDLKLSYRYQWTGFGPNSPKFINLSYNTRIKQPLDLNYNSLRISNPDAVRIPKLKRSIHGLSGQLFQTNAGVLTSFGAGVMYGFHYPLTQRITLSLGGGMVIENRKLDLDEITVRDPDPFYTHLLNSSTSQTDLNLRAGFLVYTNSFYIGATYLPLLLKSIQSSDIAYEEPYYTGAFMIGKAFPLNPNFILKPSVTAFLLKDNSMIIDTQVKGYVNNVVWAGLGYRSIESGVVMLGLNFNEKFSAGYTYEFGIGSFNRFSGSSHELVLGMRLNNFKKENQYTW